MINSAAEHLGNYRLIRRLGSGGFADVYLGEHIHLKTLTAIKVLRAVLAPTDIERFLQEARTIARLNHPHIVRVLDYEVHDTTPFLVMDYAPKGTLRQAHPRGSVLPLPLVVTYVKQVAAALQHAHDAKLIHRDVKPDNMLLDNHDEVLLSDFGIAVAAHNTSSLQTLDRAGTPLYMAPELILGKPRPASDQYALAIVVYEWLCGTPPFQGELMHVLNQQASTPAPPLHKKVPTISPSVEQVVLRALNKDPQQRFPSVEAFATALEQAAQEHSAGHELSIYRGHDSTVFALTWSPDGKRIVSADLDGHIHLWAPTQGGPYSMKRSLQMDAEAAGTVAWSADGRSLAVGTSSRRMRIWDVTTGISSRQHFIPGMLATIAMSPDGMRLAAGSIGDDWEDGQTYIVQTWDMQTGASLFTFHLRVRLRGGGLFAFLSESAVSIRWQPDSRRIVLARRDNIVETWDIISRKRLSSQSYLSHADEADSIFLSPDGKRLAAIRFDGAVEIWDAASGNIHCSYRGHTRRVTCITWSPDSERIASFSLDGAIQVWDAATGRHCFTYCDQSQNIGVLAWSPDGKSIASANKDQSIRIWRTA